MKGYIINYKPKDKTSKVLLQHTLYGRLSARNYKGRKTLYYYPGCLDNIRFFKIKQATVFVETIEGLDTSLLKIFGEFSITEREIEGELPLVTGRDYWKKIADDRKILYKVRSV